MQGTTVSNAVYVMEYCLICCSRDEIKEMSCCYITCLGVSTSVVQLLSEVELAWLPNSSQSEANRRHFVINAVGC